MITRTFRALLALGALATTAAAATGCVADRPSRNGVFNENQYVRKDFLVRPGDGSKPDTGWIMKSTILSASTPNPLANLNMFVGAESGGALVRFMVTQDKLELLNLREMGAVDPNQESRIPEVVNSWPITNVDLKYRINLDGEKSNFYEENQELDWQVRQWVKINFAKNDMSDVAPFGEYMNYYVQTCTDVGNASVTLVPGSFSVDEAHDYMQWAVQITLPVKYDNTACTQAYGEAGTDALRIGRNSVTFNMMYSFARATPPDKITYQPWEIAEKDPILHKYGPFRFNSYYRDPDSGLLATRSLVMRFDPQKDIVWYFAKGYPDEYKGMFTDPGGVVDQTNQILAKSGAKGRLVVKNYDQDLEDGQPPRQYGDVRYSFLRWESDLDTGSPFAGVTQFVTDPRTGETLSASINIAGFAIKDYYVQRINAYLKSIGAEQAKGADGKDDPNALDVNNDKWPDGPPGCKDGDTMPLVDSIVKAQHNLSSTLYTKMQISLQKPPEKFGALGPIDFIQQHPADDDFWKAYYALAPYTVFGDPAMNAYVTPEGFGGVYGGPAGVLDRYAKEHDFQQLASKIDRGENPFDDVAGTNGLKNATDFMNKMRDLTLNHRDLEYILPFTHPYAAFDTKDVVSLQGVMLHDGRHCINGHWETKDEWVNNLIHTYWTQVVWHEFGHSLGLEHNFMASVDKPNYPHYTDGAGRDHIAMYASSVMEYNGAADRVFWHAGWAPYDQGALGFIYGNNQDNTRVGPVAIPAGKTVQGISGEATPTAPWNDPYGFDDKGQEKQYLFCTHEHMKYTPLCRQGDMGATPSEIIANALDNYEWQYQWRNFRMYRKYWDDSPYANTPAALITDMRKFMSLWVFDWNSNELSDSLRRIGFKNPDPNGSDQQYYSQLENKFNAELSAANAMAAAFHNAVIQQSAGERPYKSIYDKYYGDVTQQGIILDKFFAMQGWTALWPTDNYDVNQAGSYLASYEGLGDSFFNFVAEQTVDTMIGGQYDVFPWFVPSAVAQFAQDTHSPSFGGRVDVRDWIGGFVFHRLQDFLDYFRDIAVQNNLPGASTTSSTPVVGGTPQTVSITLKQVLGFNVGDVVTVDVGNSQEQAAIQNISGESVTLTLTKPHSGTYLVVAPSCTDVRTCSYDPRATSDNVNEFIGPDHRLWTWAYVPDRNTWIAAQKERHTATYIIIRNYNADVVKTQDDGAHPGSAYGLELPMKYTLDAFEAYN